MNLRGRHSLTSIGIVPARQYFFRIFKMLLFQNRDAASTQTLCFGLAGLCVAPMLPRDRSLAMEGPYSVSPFLGSRDSSCSRNWFGRGLQGLPGVSRVSRVWKLHGLALQSCSVAWPTKAANKKVKLIIAGITQHGVSYMYEDGGMFMYSQMHSRRESCFPFFLYPFAWH